MNVVALRSGRGLLNFRTAFMVFGSGPITRPISFSDSPSFASCCARSISRSSGAWLRITQPDSRNARAIELR